MKLFHHFFPTIDSQGTSVYVDETAIPNMLCPDDGFDYYNNDVGSITIVNSWQECGKVNVLRRYLSPSGQPIFYTAKQCKSNMQCYFWSWNHTNRRCYLKNSYGLTKRKKNNQSISGSKECQGNKHKWISDTKIIGVYIKHSTACFQTTESFQAEECPKEAATTSFCL